LPKSAIRKENSKKNIFILFKFLDMSLIKDSWDVSKEILSLSSEIKAGPSTDRDKLSQTLSEISDLLNDIYIKMKQKVYPRTQCNRLSLLCDDLYEKSQNLVGKDKARMLSDQLLGAVQNSERAFEDFVAEKISYMDIQQLEEASGKFKACSVIIN
jgi:hypothetical protein